MSRGQVYITGDKHASFRPFFGLRDRGLMTAEDIILITGDAGYIWDEDYPTQLKTLQQIFPGTLAFIDGNHENHVILNRFPEETWMGGRVHRVGDRIYHLMRGELYNINGAVYYTLGGARTVSSYIDHVAGVDYWPELEIPNAQELAYCLQQFEAHLPEIDYVITHEAPLFARSSIARVKPVSEDYTLPSVLETMFEQISASPKFKKWYFGHMHVDQLITPRLRGIHNNIVPAGSEEKISWA